MKKAILSLTMFLITMATFAITVPPAVKNAFAKMFPAATNIKWDKENAHEYEAGFTSGGKKFSANFSEAGEWLETESNIAFAALPETVRTSFLSSHKNNTIKAAAKIEKVNGGIQYEIEYMQGKKTKELMYNEAGKLLK